MPRQAFLGILEAEPALARRILELTANRLRGSSERESALAFLDAQARLARLLLQLEQQAPEKGYVTISQEELAQRTGQTRQTVAKALGRWRQGGLAHHRPGPYHAAETRRLLPNWNRNGDFSNIRNKGEGRVDVLRSPNTNPSHFLDNF